jgi:hypothetical protein
MSRRLSVTDLLADVRSMIDEDNLENISDDLDILPALNRAQDYAANILARHYESPMLKKTDVALTAGESEYDIPEDAFEQRLEKVEVNPQQVFYPLKRLDFRDVTLYETPTRVNVPYYYTVIGSKFRLLPNPTASFPLRIWYLKDPDFLVKPQGRLTFINTTDNFITVDEIGSDLTTEVDELESYINLVDGQTGEIKRTMQIKSISGTKITFKTTPTRTSVLNRTVSGTIGTDVAEDDFICTIFGTAVPFFKKPFSNFLIQYAIAEIQMKLGGPADIALRVRKELEEQVERSWVGREQSLRVKKRSRNWAVPTRRYFNNS